MKNGKGKNGKSIIFVFVLFLAFMLNTCGEPATGTPADNNPVSQSIVTNKSITSFFVVNPMTEAEIDGTNINLTLPYGWKSKTLVVYYETTGILVYANGLIQNSGKSTNDFSNPVVYTVTAIDGSVRNYLVKTIVSSTQFTVTFDKCDGSASFTTFTSSNLTLTEPIPPSKVSNAFCGWFLNTNSQSKWNFSKSRVKSAITLYAKWTHTYYTIRYDTAGGSALADLNVPIDSLLNVPTPPTKLNNVLTGWYTDAGFTSEWNFTSDKVIADTTLYAKWVPVYRVAFNSSGGSTLTNIFILSNATFTAPAIPTKLSNVFGGWYKDSGYTSAWNFTTDRVTGYITLYAKWIPAYFVIFDSQSGTSVSSTNVLSNMTLIQPLSPTKASNAFSGWYKDAGCTLIWNFTTDRVKTNTVLYAKWMKKYFVVTFNTLGGSTIISEIGLKSNSTLTQPADPTKAYCDFLGWYSDSNYTVQWNFLTDRVKSDLTLFVKWFQYEPAANFMYETVDGGIRIINYSGPSTNVIVPKIIDGKPVTIIGECAFNMVNAYLKNIVLPDSVTTLEQCAFLGCENMTNIVLPSGLKYIGVDAFSFCFRLSNITLPSGLKFIGNSTFVACYGLRNIVLPDSITNIGSGSFLCCVGLTNVVLPSVLKSLTNSIFEGCTNLKKIIIPSGITYLGNRVFSDCSSLTNVTVLATTPPVLETDAFSGTPASLKIYVPAASTNAYKTASGWSAYAAKIVAIP